MTTASAVAAGIPRWIALALPEDAAQEVALVAVEYPHLTDAARLALLRQRMRVLRHEIWDRIVTRIPRADPGLRPSKLARRRGYRRNKEATRGM